MYSEKQYNDFLQEITANNIPYFSTDWFNKKWLLIQWIKSHFKFN